MCSVSTNHQYIEQKYARREFTFTLGDKTNQLTVAALVSSEGVWYFVIPFFKTTMAKYFTVNEDLLKSLSILFSYRSYS